MFLIVHLIALIALTAGTPFPDYLNGVDPLESVPSDTVGWDIFHSETSSTVTEDANSGTSDIFSLASAPADSLFAEDPPGPVALDTVNLAVPLNLPSTLTTSEEAAAGDTFSTIYPPDDLLDDFLDGNSDVNVDGDGSGKPLDLASNPSMGLADSADRCGSEVVQSYGKWKRLICQNPESETASVDEEPTILDEEPTLVDEEPTLDDKPGPIPGFDEPGIPQTTICGTSFTPVCCSGSKDLGLTQTGCDECRDLSLPGGLLPSTVSLILTCAHRFGQQLEESSLL